ncbi:MAG TPA: hypothetical protein VIK04_16480 [Solirubrobacteraceae bacterium]
MPVALSEADQLSPEQVADELRSWAAAVPGVLAVAAGPDGVVAPDELSDVLEVIELQQQVIDALEVRWLSVSVRCSG